MEVWGASGTRGRPALRMHQDGTGMGSPRVAHERGCGEWTGNTATRVLPSEAGAPSSPQLPPGPGTRPPGPPGRERGEAGRAPRDALPSPRTSLGKPRPQGPVAENFQAVTTEQWPSVRRVREAPRPARRALGPTSPTVSLACSGAQSSVSPGIPSGPLGRAPASLASPPSPMGGRPLAAWPLRPPPGPPSPGRHRGLVPRGPGPSV